MILKTPNSQIIDIFILRSLTEGIVVLIQKCNFMIFEPWKNLRVSFGRQLMIDMQIPEVHLKLGSQVNTPRRFSVAVAHKNEIPRA